MGEEFNKSITLFKI